MPHRLITAGRRQQAFAYVEVLLSVLLLSVLLTPALQALGTGILGSGNTVANRHFALRSRLEEALAAFHLALEERTRERVPLDWAQTN